MNEHRNKTSPTERRAVAVQKLRDAADDFAEQVAPFYDAVGWHPFSHELPTAEGVAELIRDKLQYLEEGANTVESGGIIVGIDDEYGAYITFKYHVCLYAEGGQYWPSRSRKKNLDNRDGEICP